MKLCCYFNYAPLYRKSIYQKLDQTFDVQFYFGKEVYENGRVSGIEKIDYSIFKNKPIEFENKTLFRKFAWRTKSIFLAFKKYDTFLITGDFVFSYIPLILLCRLLNKRIYGWGHGVKTNDGKMRIFTDFMYKNLTGFFTYGEKGKNRLIELGYLPDKIHVIYNSLDGPIDEKKIDYGSLVYADHFKNRYPVILFIGRLTPQKQLDWLIKAHGELNRSGLKCNLMIIGDGVAKQDLVSLSTKEGYANQVWFYGKCYDDNLNSEFIYNADVCVSPGNVGLTALHSMKYGVPAISHDDFESQGPEFETIVPYSTGILFKKGSYIDFYQSIKEWFVYAEKRKEEIRHNCYAMINEKWNSDNQIRIIKEVFERDAK